MNGHSREVLSALGIDVWISRGAVSQELSRTSIWRDLSIPEMPMENFSLAQELTIEEDLSDLTSFVETKIETKKELPVEVIDLPVANEVEVRPQLVIDPFNIQALVIPHAVLLTETTEITSEQQKLWVNIQRGIYAEFSELSWPFALADLQDGYGLQNYIQGFIDSIALEKNIIVLGKIPHFVNSKMTHLASLQEMLDEPLLKRHLWEVIKNNGKLME